MNGFETAVHEISLAFFTTVAPSGIFACIFISGLMLSGLLNEKECLRLSHWYVFPLSFAMMGLIASATHLGTPSNALYVLSAIGQSPLSNEIACCVIFLAASGFFWLYSFSLKINMTLFRAWLGISLVTGLFAVGGISVAYSEATILTWNTWHVPLSVWLSGGVGGAFVMFSALCMAGFGRKLFQLARVFVIGSFAIFILSWIVYSAQYFGLSLIRNGIGYASDLAGVYPIFLVLYGVLSLVSFAVVGLHLKKFRALSGGRSVLAVLLFMVGLFSLRFGFYMIHMTTGISL